jgi:PAS domain S-box-containing protein
MKMRLKIRFKVILIGAILLVVLIGLIYPISTLFIINSFNSLEDEMAMQDMGALEDELDQELMNFHHFSQALSSNDRTYEYANNDNISYMKQYEEEELVFETFERYKANFIAILELDDSSDPPGYNLLYSKAYDLALEVEDRWPSDMDDHLQENFHLFEDFINTRSENSGYLELNQDIYMISSRPILTTSNQGPLNGAVVMGRLISVRNVYLKFPIKEEARLDMHLVSSQYHPTDFQEVIDSREYDMIHIKKLTETELAGYMIKKDFHGDPIFIYKVTVPRHIYQEGLRTFYIYFIIIVVVVIVGVVQMAFINERVVINRLTTLSRDVKKITKSNDPSNRVKVEGRDEMKDLGGNINEMLSSIQRSQVMIKESEEKYRKLVTISPTGIVITVERKIDFVNDMALKITGTPKREYLMGKDILDLVPPDQLSASKIIQNELSSKGYMERPVTVTFTTTEGRFTEMEIMATRFQLKEKDAVMYIFQDVTERNRNRREMEERELRYRTLFEMSTDAIFLAKDNLITDCNKATLDLFECEMEDLIGISPAVICPEFQPDGKRSEDEIMKNIGKLYSGESIFSEWDHQTFSGRIIKTEIAMRIIELQNEPFIFVLVRDITSRKEQEEKIKEERNRAELYLDLLGHDIGNMHQGIHSSLEMAKYMAEDPDTLRKYLDQSTSLVEKSMQFVRYVKILSAPDQNGKAPVEIVSHIESGIRKAVNSFPSVIVDVRRNLPEEDIMINSDPIIEEVFYNIVHNAVKVQRNIKDPRIEVEMKVIQNVVSVVISDHGPGITDEKKKTIFDRYKSGGSLNYTGIGLSIVKNLMDRYGKEIVVKDRVRGDSSQGASFNLTFEKV